IAVGHLLGRSLGPFTVKPIHFHREPGEVRAEFSGLVLQRRKNFGEAPPGQPDRAQDHRSDNDTEDHLARAAQPDAHGGRRWRRALLGRGRRRRSHRIVPSTKKWSSTGCLLASGLPASWVTREIQSGTGL